MIEKAATKTNNNSQAGSAQTSGHIPRVSRLSSLGKTRKLNRKIQEVAAVNLEEQDLTTMKGYITKVESVLQEMKDWVDKKEKSISSKASFTSKKSLFSNGGGLKADKYKRSQRAKIFFGFTERTVDHSNTCANNLNDCIQEKANKLTETSHLQEPKGGLGVYIKECFIANIKQRMLPPQRRRNAIHRNKSGQRLDKFSQHLPKGCLRDENFEFLTPVKQASIRKSVFGMAAIEDQNDSLVYTVSRRRSSLRMVSTEATEGAINNFD